MKTTIVYESMFGHTEGLAEAVAHGLRDRGGEVVLVRAGDPLDHDLAGTDLLVLAAPTHALSLSRAGTRADAAGKGADEAGTRTGIREWLAAAAATGTHPPVAVFDTRVRVARHWPGSASRTATRSLRRLGFTVVGRTSFYVLGTKGPLVEGEEDRAREWGHELARPAVPA